MFSFKLILSCLFPGGSALRRRWRARICAGQRMNNFPKKALVKKVGEELVVKYCREMRFEWGSKIKWMPELPLWGEEDLASSPCETILQLKVTCGEVEVTWRAEDELSERPQVVSASKRW